MQPMTPAILEQMVLGKPYFDREGLIVAVDDERPVGFAHAGFGVDATGAALSTQIGSTCMLMVGHHGEQAWIARELLAASETYLRARGASVLQGGCCFPVDPFYLGLYGGSQLSGVHASDTRLCELFRGAGYSITSTRRVLQRPLAGFRPPVDRAQMQSRRTHVVQATPDPRSESWWEACTTGQTERARIDVRPRSGGGPGGSVVLWDLQPIAMSWGVRARGIVDVKFSTPEVNVELAVFLLAEALRHAQSEGATLAELHVACDDPLAESVYAKLGFSEVDRVFLFRRPA